MSNYRSTHFDYITEVSWAQIAQDVALVNKPLFDTIEQLSPDDSYKLFKIRYPYGQNITKRGVLHLPDNNGNFHPYDHPDIPLKLKKQLSYAVTPLILQMHHTSELCYPVDHNMVLPIDVFHAGELHGLPETIATLINCPAYPSWDVISGARSVFMLPQIADQVAHQRLCKEFELKTPQPKTLSAHWHTFKDIIDKTCPIEQWYSEILVFTDQWFIDRDKDINWMRFHKFLLATGWRQAQYRRAMFELNTVWKQLFAEIERERSNPSSYVIDTFRHLVNLSHNIIPGFRPTYNDRRSLPLEIIQAAYLDVYQLKDYYPTLMVAENMSDSPGRALYYSMGHPTLPENRPAQRVVRSKLVELNHVEMLMRTFKNIAMPEESQSHHIYQNTQKTNIVFFDSDINPNSTNSNIINIQKLTDYDKSFIPASSELASKRTLASKNSFYKGCILLQQKIPLS